jgi:hypothetical protein
LLGQALGDGERRETLKEHPINKPYGHDFIFVYDQPSFLASVVSEETAVPLFGLRGSCRDSMRFTPTSSKKNRTSRINASDVYPLCHQALPMQ